MFLRNEKSALEAMQRLERGGEQIATTSINIHELYTGAYFSKNPAKKINDILTLMEIIDVLDFDKVSAKHSGLIMSDLKQRKIVVDESDWLGDVLTAAVAKKFDATIVTNDNDFANISGIKIERW